MGNLTNSLLSLLIVVIAFLRCCRFLLADAQKLRLCSGREFCLGSEILRGDWLRPFGLRAGLRRKEKRFFFATTAGINACSTQRYDKFTWTMENSRFWRRKLLHSFFIRAIK